jgi:pimeloyl-ACP methyl ester carboxylesterase
MLSPLVPTSNLTFSQRQAFYSLPAIKHGHHGTLLWSAIMTPRRRKIARHKKKRKRLAKSLFWGAAAVSIPALANAVIARRNRRLESPTWGRSRRFAWEHGEIDFQEIGDGPPLVLIHSLGPGHDAEQWRDAGLILARHRRVFALDLLGWGHSDKPRVEYDGELNIQLLNDFVEEIVREPTVLAAAGLAAPYAVQVATDSPEIISGLALSAPVGLEILAQEPDLTDALTNRALRLPLVGTTALNLYTSRAAINRHLRHDIFAAADRVDAARVEHHYLSSHQPGSHLALAALLSGYLNHDIRSVLSRLDKPVWLGWGRQSTSPTIEAADLWLNRLQEAELEVFEGVGNHPHVEAPQAFADALAVFLDRLAI